MTCDKIKCLLVFLFISIIGIPCFSQYDSIPKIAEPFSKLNDTILKDELNAQLLEAADQGDVDKVIALLLKGADVNAHNDDGVSALMYATQNGHLDVAKILVFNGAHINARPAGGETALIAATRFNHYDMMDYLIQHGADINAKDDDSCTALFYAAAYGYFIPADMLIFYGADIGFAARDSSDALIAACFYGNKDVAELLLRKGANINSKDKYGWTPLHCAVYQNHFDIVKMLVDTGATVNVKNSEGYTPLAIACENGYSQIAEYLLSNKANPTIYTDIKATPLLLALYNHKTGVAATLKKQAIVRKEWKPYINNINISLSGFDLNGHDFMYGAYAGIQDLRYLAGIRFGFDTRFWANRILLPIADSSYYQLWERRSFMYLEAEKIFRINSYSNFEKGFFVSLKELYTYGRYRAMKEKPDDAFIFSPSAGFTLYNKWIGFRFAYEYMKFNVKDLSPHRISISMFFTIKMKNINKTYKNIDWL